MASGGSNKPKDSITEQSDTYSELSNDHLKLTIPHVTVEIQNFGTQPTQPPVGIIKNLENNLHDEVVPSQDIGIFVDPSSVPRPKNRLSRSQNKRFFNAQRLTSPDNLTSQTTPPPFVVLEKLNVHAQDNCVRSQDSDEMLTPKRTSKLSRSNNRRIQNLKKPSDSESCSISQDSSTPMQSKGTPQSATPQSQMSDNEEYLRRSTSLSGTCSGQGERSKSPIQKQNTHRTRKTMGKKQAELSSQSDTNELPDLLYVPLLKSTPTVAGTPVASTSKANKRPMTPVERQRACRARKAMEAKKGTVTGDGQSSQSDSNELSSPLHVSIFHSQSESPLKKSQ